MKICQNSKILTSYKSVGITIENRVPKLKLRR